MSSPIIHDTFVLTRDYPKSPAAVFAAFADPGKKRRWYGEGRGHDVESFTMDFRVGGEESFVYRLDETTPFKGVEMASTGRYEDIVPDQRIIVSATMSLGGNRISVTLVTFELAAIDTGTRLVLTHQAVFLPGADGPAMRRGGWEALLDKLGQSL